MPLGPPNQWPDLLNRRAVRADLTETSRRVPLRTSQLLDELKRLPMRPSAVTGVLAVLDDPNAGARDIASALQTDPSLCARILHLANSPYFGLSGKVGNVERAIVALGNSTIRSLAVSTAAGLFGDSAQELPDGFRSHSVGVAAGASIAARFVGVPAGDALCAGLLHDLGSALLYRFEPTGYDERMAVQGRDLDELLREEDAAAGGDHAIIGGFALDAWHLPETIVDAVRLHHAADIRGAEKLVRVVAVGDALAVAARPESFPHEQRDPEAALGLLGCAGLNAANLVQRTAEEADALDAVFAAV
jgi:putative nucleotidyltransferase with HDIG domain